MPFRLNLFLFLSRILVDTRRARAGLCFRETAFLIRPGRESINDKSILYIEIGLINLDVRMLRKMEIVFGLCKQVCLNMLLAKESENFHS